MKGSIIVNQHLFRCEKILQGLREHLHLESFLAVNQSFDFKFLFLYNGKKFGLDAEN